MGRSPSLLTRRGEAGQGFSAKQTCAQHILRATSPERSSPTRRSGTPSSRVQSMGGKQRPLSKAVVPQSSPAVPSHLPRLTALHWQCCSKSSLNCPQPTRGQMQDSAEAPRSSDSNVTLLQPSVLFYRGAGLQQIGNDKPGRAHRRLQEVLPHGELESKICH